MGGYAGSILYVDLTSGDMDVRPLDLEFARNIWAAWGLEPRFISIS